MISRRQLMGRAALASLAIPATAGRALAQADYPTQPIRTICMFPPGTGADIRIRFYASKLARLAGRNVVVENRPGAFGNIATETVARARPDGYTIYIAPGSSTLAASPHLFKKLNYDPIKDFEHVTTLMKGAFILIVPTTSGINSVAELVARLKTKQDHGFYGTIAVPSLVAGETFKAAFGLKTTEVKYKAQGGLINDLLSGRLDFMFIDFNTFGAQLKEGKVKALSTTTANSLKAIPGVPGAVEAGIPNMDVPIWWSVHVPAKTPQPIIDKLERWFNEITADPEVVAFNARTGADPFPGTQASVRAYLIEQTKVWAEYAKIARIVPQ
jgi:tripartite-type tricarboxylate transporter receptor subunit TctC